MAETPKRRLLDQLGAAPTYVAAASRITGDLEVPGALVMCGQVRGDGDVKGALSVAAGAQLGRARCMRAARVVAGAHHRRHQG